MQRKANADIQSFFADRKAKPKLRTDLPNTFSIDKMPNGGYVIWCRLPVPDAPIEYIAAVSNDADLLAWITGG